MAEGLKLEIGGDVKQAEQALKGFVASVQQAGQSIQQSGAQMSNSFGAPLIKNLNDLQRTFANLKQNIRSVRFDPIPNTFNSSVVRATNNLQKLPNASNAATLSMINLGRVVQDAPFGFLGIANNLNPLLESFQRLRAQTGSAGGALKSLGSSMLGAGGIGLAVSVVSSLLVVFGDRLFGTSKKSKEAEDALQSLATKVTEGAVKLTSLVGIIQNVNSSYDDKTKALKAINQEYGDYLKSIGIEEATVGNLQRAYEGVVQAMLKQAVVKGLQDQIAAKVQETAKKIVSLQIAEQNRQAAADAATQKRLKGEDKFQKVQQNAAKQQELLNKPVSDGIIAQQQYNQELTSSVEAGNDYESVLKRTEQALMDELKPLLSLTTNFEDLGIKLDKTGDKTKDFINKAKQLAEELRKIGFIQPEFSFFDSFETQLAKARKVFDDFNAKRFRLDPNFFKIEGEFSMPSPDRIADELNAFQSGLQKGIIKLPPTELPVTFTALEARNAEIIRDFQSQMQQLGGVLKIPEGALQDPALYNALSGQVDDFIEKVEAANVASAALSDTFVSFIRQVSTGKAPIQAFFQALAQQLIEITAKLAAAALRALFFKIILGGSTGGAAAVGKGFLKGAISGFRAEGGPVSGGSTYVVGEKGPELFVPNVAGRIIPNSDMAMSELAYAGGGVQRVVVTGRLRGRDMALQNERTGRSQRRLNG